MTLRYPVDGQLMSVAELPKLIPYVSKDALRARLISGWCSLERLKEPASAAHIERAEKRQPRGQRNPEAFVFIPPPCPLNALFREWRHAGKGRALQSLDVHTDPLRPTLGVRA